MVSDFWTPEFNITHRPDGTILMVNADPLMDYLPTLADYLDGRRTRRIRFFWDAAMSRGNGKPSPMLRHFIKPVVWHPLCLHWGFAQTDHS